MTASQKYVGLEASGSVNQATADALTNARFHAHGLADAGTLVETDKDKQLLYIVHNGRTVAIYNTSTGDGQPYAETDQNTPGEVLQTGVRAVHPRRVSARWTRRAGRPASRWCGPLAEVVGRLLDELVDQAAAARPCAASSSKRRTNRSSGRGRPSPGGDHLVSMAPLLAGLGSGDERACPPLLGLIDGPSG